MAISDQAWVVYHKLEWGGINAEGFHAFLTNLKVNLGDEQAVIIMDSALAHRDAQMVDPLHPVHMLPSHSPFLNHIENVFSVHKAGLKQHLYGVQQLVDDLATALAAGHRSLIT